MIWAKRRFEKLDVDYAPYQETMWKLMLANAQQYQEFLMFSVEVGPLGESDYYIGLPAKAFIAAFDGFQEVSEVELPKEIDTFLLGDQTKEPFTNRFKFRERFR
jgi:hypothetical protein